jgi:hypothetical protein
MQVNHKRIFIFTVFLMIGLILINEFGSNKKPPTFSSLTKMQIDTKYIDDPYLKNVIIIEPYFNIIDYASEEIFYEKLNEMLKSIRHLINKNTMIIFPPKIGFWFIVINESFKIHLSSNTSIAFFRLIIEHPFLFLKNFFITNFDLDKSLYLTYSDKIFEVYYRIFSTLAKKYSVKILAGTNYSKMPYIKDHLLFQESNNQLYEYSILFSEEGLPLEILSLEKKSNVLEFNPFKDIQIYLDMKSFNKEQSDHKRFLYLGNDLSIFKEKCINFICYGIPFRGKIWEKNFSLNPIINSKEIKLDSKNYVLILK